jgi:hypothetical protein
MMNIYEINYIRCPGVLTVKSFVHSGLVDSHEICLAI